MRLLPTSLSLALALALGCGATAGEEAPEDAVSESELRGSDSATIREQLDARRAYLSSLPSTSTARCDDTWRGLTEDGVLDIVVARGYVDTELPIGTLTADESNRATMTQHLTAPCVEGYQACGFRVVDDDKSGNRSVLVKSARTRDARPLEIRITTTHSSFSLSDETNRGPDRAAQERQSRLAKAVFDEGIENADVVFYAGHARDGGGPDFGPPRLVPGSSHVDYGWYQTHRPGLNDLLARLRSPTKKVKMLGLFACATKGHFEGALRQADPRLGLIHSYKVTESEVLEVSLVGAIDAAIAQKCNDSFQKSVNVDPQRKVELVNFF